MAVTDFTDGRERGIALDDLRQLRAAGDGHVGIRRDDHVHVFESHELPNPQLRGVPRDADGDVELDGLRLGRLYGSALTKTTLDGFGRAVHVEKGTAYPSPTAETFAMQEANRALATLKRDGVRGAAVLRNQRQQLSSIDSFYPSYEKNRRGMRKISYRPYTFPGSRCLHSSMLWMR